MKLFHKMAGAARCADRTPPRSVPAFLMLAAFLFAAIAGRAQLNPIGHATDFTSESYYEAPHETQVKMRLSGAEASPLPGGLLDVKQLRLEMFSETGRTNAVVEAPDCNYSPMDGVASSSGPLTMHTGDGRFRVEGEGFLWRQNDSSLTISNRVHTVIASKYWKLTAP
jgi:hypothetical protein